MNRKFKDFDNIGTISWLLMDTCWMFEFGPGVIFFASLALIFIFLSLFAYRGFLREHLEYVISYIWFITNFLWASQDVLGVDELLAWAKIAFVVNIVLIAINWLLFGKLKLSRKIKLT